MRKFIEYPAVLVCGGAAYGLLEILFRGYTHWSMLIAGGICAALIYLVSHGVHARLWQKWVMGAAIISAVEFIAGCTVNILLGWGVWDYSDRAFNLLGQICPLFCFIWLALCVPVVWVFGKVRGYFTGDTSATARRTSAEK